MVSEEGETGMQQNENEEREARGDKGVNKRVTIVRGVIRVT